MIDREGSSPGAKANVGIIGGGILGLTLGYRFAKDGHRVTLYERDSSVGGLVRSITLNGISIDRFYHVILTSDRNWIGLIAELGLRDRIYFKETKAGFYYHGRTYSMATISEYLLFPLLSIGTLREILEAIAQGEVRRSLSDNPDDVHLVTRSAHGINTAQSFAARGDGSYQRQPATGC